MSIKNRYLNEIFETVNVQEDIPFGSLLGYYNEIEELKLDVYSPANDKENKRQAIILVHGGGFVSCTRKQEYIVELAKIFAKLGYVCFSPEYRLWKKADSPGYAVAPLSTSVDIELARQYIIKNSDEFGIDVDNMVIIGGSAGGMASNEACKIKNAYRALICLWGAPEIIRNPEQYPDTLIIHGTKDEAVDYSLSEKLLSALTENDIHAELITLDDAVHTPFDRRDEYLPRIITFIDERMN